MSTTYRVSFRQIEPRRNGSGKITSYSVRWDVEDTTFRESFKRYSQADSFRSELVAAARRGEAFDTVSGRPLSWEKDDSDLSWFDLAIAYVDLNWADSVATARQTIAEALIRVMPVFVPAEMNAPDPKVLRSALRQWA